MTRKRAVLLVALLAQTTACASSRSIFIDDEPRFPGEGSPSPVSTAGSTTPANPMAPQPNFTAAERQRIAYVQPWVDKAAQQHTLPPNLINAVIWVESRFQPKAKSPAGARGLMQLMPATASALAQEMGKFRAAPYDPEFNIAAGSLYLAELLERYRGDVRLALAAYNAGAGNVDKWTRGTGLPPVSEQYVQLVLDAQRRFDAWNRPSTVPVPGDTMIAKAHTPKQTRDGVPVQRPKPREPGPPPDPDDIVPDPPVRYDLDRVESEYVPSIDPEPPLRDTPWPPIEETKKREPKVIPEPDEATPEPGPDEATPDAAPNDGELPSVLD